MEKQDCEMIGYVDNASDYMEYNGIMFIRNILLKEQNDERTGIKI
ncbi:UNVERIFIED_CONTAM: hypothetical protein ABID98_003137 [Brevibacillus sp. OAP136]